MRQILLGLSLCLAFIATAAPSKQPTEVQQLQQQMQALQATVVQQQSEILQLKQQDQMLVKELSVFQPLVSARLEMQDKRVADFGISTSWLGIAVAALGALITFIALVAGFAGYVTAGSKAEKEAKETSEKWFKEKGNELITGIETLKLQARQAQEQVQARAAEANQTIKKHETDAAVSVERLKIFASGAMQPSTTPTDPPPHLGSSQESAETVKDASQALGAKPENDFSAEDHYTRGLAELIADRVDSALLHFRKAVENATTESIPAIKHAKFMLAECLTLGQLNMHKEALAVSDSIDKLYGKDNSPEMRELVARALFNKGLRLSQLNPDEDIGDDIKVYDLVEQRYGNDDNPVLREQVAKALFNKGTRIGKFRHYEQEIVEFDLIIDRYGADDNSILRILVAQSLVNKAYRLSQLLREDHEDIEIYDSVIQRYGDDDSPKLREQVAKALLNKGASLSLKGLNNQAKKVLQNVVQEFSADSGDEIQSVVSNAQNLLKMI